MPSSINSLKVRQALGRDDWGIPKQFGQDGWLFKRQDGDGALIVTAFDYETPDLWIHASISRKGRLPSYGDLVMMHVAVFGDGYAYQVFAPPTLHVNIHEFALHLFGRADGKPALPEFAIGGSI